MYVFKLLDIMKVQKRVLSFARNLLKNNALNEIVVKQGNK